MEKLKEIFRILAQQTYVPSFYKNRDSDLLGNNKFSNSWIFGKLFSIKLNSLINLEIRVL
jgi:hypothetical protein